MIIETYQRHQDAVKKREEQVGPVGSESMREMVQVTLEDVADEIAFAAWMCAIPRWFNAEMILAFAGGSLTSEQAEEILTEIRSWPFVHGTFPGQFIYRKEARRYLRETLRAVNPALFQALNQRMVDFFTLIVGDQTTFDETNWFNLHQREISALREKIYHLLQVDPARGMEQFRELFLLAQRLKLSGEAAMLFQFTSEIDRASLPPAAQAELSYFEAVLLASESNPEEAIILLQDVLRLAPEPELRAKACAQLGALLAEKRQVQPAIQAFEQAYRLYDQLKKPHESAVIANNLGNLFLYLNERGKAEKLFKKALKELQASGTPAEQSLSYNNLGNLYAQKEEWNRALEYYQRSLEIKIQINDAFGAATTQTNIATVYQRMVQYERNQRKEQELSKKALETYQVALEIFRRIGARSSLAQLLFRMALYFYQAGQPDQARQYLPEAIAIFTALSLPELEGANRLSNLLAAA